MLNNEKIGKHGFKVFVILTFIGTSVLNIPGALIGKAKQDAWISAIVGVIVALLIVIFYNAVAQQFDNMTLVGYAHKVLGKKLGKMVSIWFVLFLLFNCASVLWIVGTFITTEIMVEEPAILINILFMLVVILGCRLGIEVIVRSAEVLYPWAITGYITLIILVLPQVRFKNFRPIFEIGVKPILHGTLLFEAFIPLTFVAFLMVFPASTSKTKEVKKSFLLAVLLAGILLVIQTIVTILVLGVDTAARSMYPSYILAKGVSIGTGLERIEAIIAMVWIIAIFYKTILYFYGTVVGVAQVLNLKDYRCLTLPLGMIIVILSEVIYPNIIYEINWDSTIWIPYVLTNAILIPLLLLVVGKVRNRKV